MQLNRYLALCGVTSRRKANFIIADGRVMVNHEVVTELGYVVDPKEDTILLDNKHLKTPVCYHYVLMNKPGGVITALVDGRRRKTVTDLVDIDDRIFPVGRLDFDTEGVLLLTNDGDIAYRLTHPKFQIGKVYEVWVEGRIDNKIIRKLSEGVAIDKGVTVSGEAAILKQENEKSLIEIRIHEGKKRQIKRMLNAVGHPVIHLQRTSFAGLTTDGLQRGEWRYLTEKEVEHLYKITGLQKAVC